MSLMGDAALREALDSGGIVIDPRPSELKAASLDLRLGPEAFLEARRLLVIPPGELVLVTTAEKMRVGPQFAAQIGLRSFYARKGLALLSGPQVDPGFHGRLHVALCNLSPIDDIRQHRGYAMSEVIREMASLSTNVGELRQSVDGYIKTSASQAKRTEAYLAIFVATIVALVIWAIAH